MNIISKQSFTILFQGDSITDCHRDRLKSLDLGFGYPAIINSYLKSRHKDKEITCYNRAIFGNTSINLKQRWNRTTLKIKPDVLSILVGINDTLRRYDRNRLTSKERFYDNYNFLLNSIMEKNENTQLVLMSPFLMPINEVQKKYFEDLSPKIEIVKSLADDYGAVYIPLNEIFSKNTLTNGDIYTDDGIHPNFDGQKIIAKAWLSATGFKKL